MKRNKLVKSTFILGLIATTPAVFFTTSTSLIAKKEPNFNLSGLTSVGDTFTKDAGGDWGGTSGSVIFSILAEPSGQNKGKVSITGNNTWVGNLVINKTISNGGKTYDVVEVGTNAFAGCTGLSGSLTIPDSISRVNSYAFIACTNLIGTLTIPSSMTYIGEGAFASCTKIEEIVFHGKGKYCFVGQAAFLNGSGAVNLLKKVEISGLERCDFGPSCFVSNGLLTEINAPDMIECSFGDGCFQACPNLEKVILGKVKKCTIGSAAFFNSSLSDIDLSSVEEISIGTAAFTTCKKLKEIALPSLIRGTFGANLFVESDNFKKFKLGEFADPLNITIEDDWLYGTGDDFELYVPNSILWKWDMLDKTAWGNDNVKLVGYEIDNKASNENLVWIMYLMLPLCLLAIGGGSYLIDNKKKKIGIN